MSERHGPGLGTKLLLSSLVLFALPWLGYGYLQELRQFLIKGQEKAQLMAASAAATALHDRDELFDPGSTLPDPLRSRSGVYAFPLESEIQIDGYLEDWGGLIDHASHHGDESLVERDASHEPGSLALDLLLGINGDYLYGVARVRDQRVIYRHPGYRRLDNSDQLRFTLIDHEGNEQRYLMTGEGAGLVTIYRMEQNWRYSLDGKPVYSLRGYWREEPNGYLVEWRLPLALLGPEQRLRIEAADVDDPRERRVVATVATLPGEWSDQLNHLVVRSPELEAILTGLGRSSAHIWVVDRYRRVRASLGGAGNAAGTDRLDEPLLERSLKGEAASRYRDDPLDPARQSIIASHPIYSGEEVVGAVVLEQDSDEILALQRQTLERAAIMTLLVLLLSVATLLLFASRLTWRIRRLNRETATAIDDRGRIVASTLESGRRTGDELGELSRGISAILRRLNHYHDFLENIPRTLRHEINNPLNAISTSLQNLGDQQPSLANNRYLQSAGRGIERLGRIMESLTEAASLEDALHGDPRTRFDLAALLHDYTESCRLSHAAAIFRYHGPDAGLYIVGSDLRIEQLLDKLVDNALDFTPVGGTIELSIEHDAGVQRIQIANDGPLLPEGLGERLFDSMVSQRTAGQGATPHLGVGLFITRAIAEHHGGTITLANRSDGTGVVATLTLPAATNGPSAMA